MIALLADSQGGLPYSVAVLDRPVTAVKALMRFGLETDPGSERGPLAGRMGLNFGVVGIRSPRVLEMGDGPIALQILCSHLDLHSSSRPRSCSQVSLSARAALR